MVRGRHGPGRAARARLRLLSPARARHQGTHRGPASAGALVKDARWLGVGAGLFTALAALLAVGAYVDYRIFSESLTSYLTFLLTALAFVAARRFLWRRLAGAYGWYNAGVETAATGHFLSTLAGHHGWGHPLLFTLVSIGGFAVCAACIGRAGVLVVRSAR